MNCFVFLPLGGKLPFRSRFYNGLKPPNADGSRLILFVVTTFYHILHLLQMDSSFFNPNLIGTDRWQRSPFLHDQLTPNVLTYSAAVSAAGRKGSVWTQAFLGRRTKWQHLGMLLGENRLTWYDKNYDVGWLWWVTTDSQFYICNIQYNLMQLDWWKKSCVGWVMIMSPEHVIVGKIRSNKSEQNNCNVMAYQHSCRIVRYERYSYRWPMTSMNK